VRVEKVEEEKVEDKNSEHSYLSTTNKHSDSESTHRLNVFRGTKRET
jgi:hypothetical protein